jgi:SAM-dependent methyltransferase
MNESEADIRRSVRLFYDQVGWSTVGEGLYQNARYEDLRPVSREYIHRCHMRLKRFLPAGGRLLLDAGSGPIQYPEYLTYSAGHRYRVCADISITALREARQRLGDRGLYVVADVSRLPFRDEAFDGVVSLHTVHHVPFEEQMTAYQDIYRTLRSGNSAVVVNGQGSSPLMRRLAWVFAVRSFAHTWVRRFRTYILRRPPPTVQEQPPAEPTGTYAAHWQARTLKAELARRGMPVEIRPWRSVSVAFLRAAVHPWLAGRLWLKLLFWLEERFPKYFGENGQYPLVVIRKP